MCDDNEISPPLLAKKYSPHGSRLIVDGIQEFKGLGKIVADNRLLRRGAAVDNGQVQEKGGNTVPQKQLEAIKESPGPVAAFDLIDAVHSAGIRVNVVLLHVLAATRAAGTAAAKAVGFKELDTAQVGIRRSLGTLAEKFLVSLARFQRWHCKSIGAGFDFCTIFVVVVVIVAVAVAVCLLGIVWMRLLWDLVVVVVVSISITLLGYRFVLGGRRLFPIERHSRHRRLKNGGSVSMAHPGVLFVLFGDTNGNYMKHNQGQAPQSAYQRRIVDGAVGISLIFIVLVPNIFNIDGPGKDTKEGDNGQA
jgi:hypothetical protein